MNPTKVITRKKGDTAPRFEANITDDGSDLSLVGAQSVKLLMRRRNGTTYKVAADMTVVDAASGSVAYQWLPADVDTAAQYEITIRVVFLDGQTRTFPSIGYIPHVIEEAPIPA